MDELVASCREAGFAAFRAKQIWNWLYIKRVNAWDAMRNVSGEVREWLAKTYSLQPVTAMESQGEESGTRKILVALGDGEHVEEVIIPTRDHETVCVSTQVGCKIGCTFCASGAGGHIRNLGAGEIVGQVLLAQQELGRRPANLVYMGMGEPLDNYDAVLKSIRILNHPDGIAIGARHITVSTSGLIPGIRRLSGEGLQIELSVSLHAPDDALRSRLMPINRAYPLAELIVTCADYAVATGRIVTFVYTLIRGVNDTREHAEALAKLIKPVQCRVNLIPLSPVEGFDGEPPVAGTAEMFMDVLDRVGINATVRMSKGTRIDAACGQLRLRRQQARKQPS